ncbi:hypothetical protein N7495_001232 [Penicillium taxi]|uniref:uncharacterized protein n=1 Tax=Penicillium taxi TaxID=168475 RepID=UPI002545450E|nr:uncharacterized protein N7495_001232 [Penicillium taxi]KAJ5908550.1 hypothetical protein N7495_001232 [Penicillium taxi]
MGDHVLFFYDAKERTGTLMAPQMIYRVIYGRPDPKQWQKSRLRFQPALLHGYQRHRVRDADYPGIVPVSEAQEKDQASKSSLKTSVLGTIVYGLSDADVQRLDQYEGSDYAHKTVWVRTLQDSQHEEDLAGSSVEKTLRHILDAAGTESMEEGEEIEAVTYLWVSPREELEEAEWDFEHFKREKMSWWIGADESEW